jgi:hypothetical protein
MDPNVPGSSNAPETSDPFARNPDGTVPDPQPADPSHVASVQPKADAPKDESKD